MAAESVGLPEVSLEEAVYAARLVRLLCTGGLWPLCRLLRGDVETVIEGVDGVLLMLSAGPVDHWLDSLRVYGEVGVLPWGCTGRAVGGRGGPQWKKMLGVLGGGGLVLNAYYVSGAGFLGLGVVVYASVSPLRRRLWSRERCESVDSCYTLRWYTVPLYLPEPIAKSVVTGEVGEDMVLEAARRSPLNEFIRATPQNCAQAAKLDRDALAHISKLLRQAVVSLPPIILKQVEWESEARPAKPSWLDLRHERVVAGLVRDVYTRVRGYGVHINPEVVSFFAGLVSEGNVLLAGPPGTGKTLLAVTLAEAAGARLISRTMHAGWTRLDLIGGPVLADGGLRWRSGVLLEAIAEALRGRLVLLLLDEVNRCDADRVFGEFFTGFSSPIAKEWRVELLLEPVCREAASLGFDETAEFVCRRLGEAVKAVQERLRIVATLNTVDYASLYSVGEAFARRFFRVMLTPEPRSVGEEFEAALDAAKRHHECENIEIEEGLQARFVDALSRLRERLEARGYVTPLPVGPGFVANIVVLAARGCRLDRESLCKALHAAMPLSTVLDEEAGRAWRELERRLGCRGES